MLSRCSLHTMTACFLLIFILLSLDPCATGRAVGPVTSVNEIVNALRDPSIEQIVLGPGVFVLDLSSASATAGGGLTIGPNRQVELVGRIDVQRILDTPGGKWPQHQALEYASGLDFGSSGQGILRLADNTTLGFRNLFIWNSLSQLGYDAQVVALVQAGVRASVRFTQTVKLRNGCLPLQIFVQHVTSYTRLADKGGQQIASLQPFCYVPPPGAAASGGGINGGLSVTAINNIDSGSNSSSNNDSKNNSSNITCVTEVLAIDDLATSITRPNGQSYNLYEQNSTYWCRAYASMSCLSASGPEQCVKELFASNGNSSAGGEPEGGNIINIVLPAVLTGVLALAFLFASVWCIRRRGAARRGSSLTAHEQQQPGGGFGADLERGDRIGGGRGVGMRMVVGGALARLLPGGAGREAQRRKPYIPGYVSVVSKEALDRIAKVRAELSSKMVVASSADDLSGVRNLRLVGKGTFGRVYKGEWKGVTVALKVISVPVSQYGQAQWQHVLGEAAISTLLNHPCLLQTYSVALLEYSPSPKSNAANKCRTSENGVAVSNTKPPSGREGDNTNTGGTTPPTPTDQRHQQHPAPTSGTAAVDDMVPFYQLKMVSEFCDGGSVVQALRGMRFYDCVGDGTMRLAAIVDIASQVASGMAYLHSANIIHADLKAANVLLKQQPGSGRLQAKVADFGLSFRLEDPEATHMTKGQLGSITHMAPEVLLHGRVSKASDVYSFGILLYEIYTGQQAYWDIPQPMLAYHVASSGGRPVLPSHCPARFRGLAKACWASEPAARPSFEEVCRRLQCQEEEGISGSANNPPSTQRQAGQRDGPEGDQTWNAVATAVAVATSPQPSSSSSSSAAALFPGDALMTGGQLLVLPSTSRPWDIQAGGAAGGLGMAGCVAPPPSQDPTAGVAMAPGGAPEPYGVSAVASSPSNCVEGP